MTMTSQTPEPENSENDELATLRQRVAELEHQLATCQHGHKHRDAASAQRMLQLIIDSLPQAIFWKNADLIYQGCNQSFAVDAGAGTPTNIVGKSDYELAWKQEQAEAFRSDDQQVIIDMTGISMVDTHVADALIRSAQAVRLLGTRVVLTGIGPAMAQTLVNLGVDLSNLVTRSTLQDGIAYALSQRRSGSA